MQNEKEQLQANLQETANNIQKMKKEVNDAAVNQDEVKEGYVTEEEELQEPELKIFNAIADMVTDILTHEEVLNHFATIGKRIGLDLSEEFIKVLGIVISSSCFNAITIYDSWLKDSMNQPLTDLSNGVNQTIADIDGIKMAMGVFRKRLDDLEKQSISDKMSKMLNH